MIKGTLYLIPALLADGRVESVLPEETINIIRGLSCFIVEEIRTARRFLIRTGIRTPVDEIDFHVFNEHSGDRGLYEYLNPALNGIHTGLLSEAGAPCVADPGSGIVKAAHELGIRVVPLTGPSSILLALMASGFNGQNFAFSGYLPADKLLRTKKIRELERTIAEKDQTQVFIETPYRNMQLFDAIVKTCNPQTLLCLATDLTGAGEVIRSQTVAGWRVQKPDIHKKPTIFLLYK